VVSFLYTSAYLSEPLPIREMRDVIDHCHSRKKQLILGCDANAHHIVWRGGGEGTGTNHRGEALMEYFLCSNFIILNYGNDYFNGM
jgi:hypothetical protein